MTMALSAPLQRALYERLSTAPELAFFEGRVFDDAPHRSAATDGVFLTLGDERVRPWNTATEAGAAHEVEIRVHGPVRGFLPVKEAAATVAAVIAAEPPEPTRGTIVTHEFTGARTRREEQGAARRIDLTFRFVIEDI
ncbi:MAG: DUF3168 domain-containing protein [Pseudomonadota bacterium]